jgi:hypothetical protein
MPRIALIHALAASVEPINDVLARDWPDAVRMNLLDDRLSSDLAASPAGLDGAMTARFHRLADYALATGAEALLYTCSAFGPCIDSVARRHASVPVLKPNEAMIEEACARAAGRPIGLVATFAPTLASMPSEFPAHVEVRTALAVGALQALQAGDAARHDALAAEAAERLVAAGCAVIALAQFSLARAHAAVADRCGCEVLTTPASAVRLLRRRLAS